MAPSQTLIPSPIKTVVVLVQENRSFDHILGWMNVVNPQIDGATGSQSNPLSTSDPKSERIFFGNASHYVEPDPGHSIQEIFEQIFGVQWSQDVAGEGKHPEPTMQGFAQNAERKGKGWSGAVMNGFKPEALPVYRELVQEFAVCDRWFAAVPASTQPNRLFVHSATSHGATGNDRKKLIEGFPQKTIFESLDEAGCSFGIYYQYPPATLFYKNLRKLKYILNNFHQFDLHFKRHCEEGKLPNYVVLEQRYFDLKLLPGNDDHPSHDVFQGQKFVKQVYEALRSSPQWNEMLFIITYDEHGGFYDHVPTPVTGVPSPDGIVGPDPYKFQFDRLGVRVPTFMISPWIEKGTVLHDPSGVPYSTSQFEHSSIAATMKKIFNLNEFLTERDAWAGTFDVVITRTSPRTDCPETLSEPVRLREADAKEDAKLSEFQEEMVQMTGVLCGDHKKEDFEGITDGMTVSDGVEYVKKAFEKFLDECEKGKQKGANESTICIPGWDHDHIQLVQKQNPSISTTTITTTTTATTTLAKNSRSSFASKLLSCFACGGGNS